MVSSDDSLFGKSSEKSLKPEAIDLASNDALKVTISNALSEKDRVRFKVQTKTTLPQFQEREFNVVRMHDDFLWLHDRLMEQEEYAGIIIPPAPPRPDFDASREKLKRLSEAEGIMTSEEFQKIKIDLEAEYLATFKKTVAMHEVFLQRVSANPYLQTDLNFKVFLEYKEDLMARAKTRKEKIGGLFQRLHKSVDELLISSTVKETDDFFEKEKEFLLAYHKAVKEAKGAAEIMIKARTNTAQDYILMSLNMSQLATVECPETQKTIKVLSEKLEELKKSVNRTATDDDLKLADTLTYYAKESEAAKDLLYRRTKCLADYEAANKALDKARSRDKDIVAASQEQQTRREKFEKISEATTEELKTFKERRLRDFKKILVELADLNLKHSKEQANIIRNCLETLRGVA